MGPSWVSLLWPAIPVPVPLYWMVEEPGAQKASLLDMKHGFCNLLERDHMTKVVDPETKAITFTIRASAFGEENTGASG